MVARELVLAYHDVFALESNELGCASAIEHEIHIENLDSGGYSTVSETAGHQHGHRGCRGSRERKWLVPARLDMTIFKSTDPGAEVMYMLWCFDVDAFLE